MAGYRTEQRFITYRGLERHFVSYEGQPANERKSLTAVPPTWYLIQGGKRWRVMDQVIGQPESEVDQHLVTWLEAQDFPVMVPVLSHQRREGSIPR